MLNKQLILDTVLTKLREQGEPSMLGGACFYYNPEEGLKCAYGHLMDMDKYSPTFEDNSLCVAPYNSTIAVEGLIAALDPIYGTVETDAEHEFLTEIQYALHDNISNVSGNFLSALETQAAAFASKHALTYLL